MAPWQNASSSSCGETRCRMAAISARLTSRASTTRDAPRSYHACAQTWFATDCWVLFGDGAGAAVFELTDTSAPFAITLGARGDAAIHAGGPSRAGSAPISMDGRAVFRFAVDALPKCLHTVLDETGLTLDNLDWVVCHQANSRIIDHCVKALHADGAKFYKNMDRHGNTSAASIPVALNELAESGQLLPGQTLACIGFGGGLTWGGMIVEYKG